MKAQAVSIRLPAQIMAQIAAISESTGKDRTRIITEALSFYLASRTPTSAPVNHHVDKLDRVVELLEDISEKLSDKITQNTNDNVRQKFVSATATLAPPRRQPRQNHDPRFVEVELEADALIVRMSGERAKLSDIANELNAMGFVCATGKEWTSSRVRDYRHKLRARGLIETA